MDTENNILEVAKRTIRIESAAVKNLENSLDSAFAKRYNTSILLKAESLLPV
ncbi:hypothetical protein JCM19298_1942 [Nonlabens ulvanivorans]|nr:hypothetical protein JCM19298_1942 [Nonlabens ulvanivorans]